MWIIIELKLILFGTYKIKLNVEKPRAEFILGVRVIKLFYPLQAFHIRFNRCFHWSLSDSRTLLSILADFNSTVVWIILILFLISSSLSLFFKPLRTVSRALTIIGITATLVFHSFFSSLARLKYLSGFLLSFIFTL